MKKRTNYLIAALPFVLVTGMMLLDACSIHPTSWEPAPAPAFSGATALNEQLNITQKRCV